MNGFSLFIIIILKKTEMMCSGVICNQQHRPLLVIHTVQLFYFSFYGIPEDKLKTVSYLKYTFKFS